MTCLGMKHDWSDGIKEGCSRYDCIVFVYAIGLLVLTCNFKLLNEYLSESCTLCTSF